MRYRDIIAEKILNDTLLVYHGSEFGPEIIESGGFEGRSYCTINGKDYRGVCVTRSREFAFGYSTVIFGLNRVKMSHRYKFLPYADDRIPSGNTPGDYRREAEEFVPADFIPLKPYLEAIWISRSSGARGLAMGEYDLVTSHPLYRGLI